MKIQLINPPVPKGFSRCTRSGCFPPLDLLSLGTYTQNDLRNIEVEILDGEILNFDQMINCLGADIVGLSPKVFSYENSLEIAKLAHERGALTVLGGSWVSPIFKSVLNNRSYIDVVVLGEGEKALSGLARKQNLTKVPNIAYRDNGQIVTTKKVVTNLDDLPEINYELVALNAYMLNYRKRFPNHGFKRPLPYYSQKGCYWYEKSGGCIFCRKQQTQNIRRSPERFWQDVKRMTIEHNADLIWDVSDTFTEPRIWVQELVNSKPKDIDCHLYLYARASDLDEEMVRMLRDICCVELLLGVESGNDELLRCANKGTTRRNILNAVKRCANCGIEVFPTFLLGLPDENQGSLEDSVSLAHELIECGNVREISSAILLPLPGSQIFGSLSQSLDHPSWLTGQDCIDFLKVQECYVKQFTDTDLGSLRDTNDVISNLVDVRYRSSFGVIEGRL